MPRHRLWYVLVVCFLSSTVTGLIAITIAVQAVRSSEQKLCRVLIELEAPDQPTTTPRGERIARSLAGLRRDYHCQPAVPGDRPADPVQTKTGATANTPTPARSE